MTIREEERDLFSVPSDYYLVHCVSADFKLGAGIAKQFDQKFDMREKLLDTYYCRTRMCKALRIGRVFNLVTKQCYFSKPTYYTIEQALKDLRKRIDDFGITKLAMPRIACGLDRKNWKEVKKIIETVFEDSDVEILVCVQ